MALPYDAVIGVFLQKITEYDLVCLAEENRTAMLDGYLNRAVTSFNKICLYDLVGGMDDDEREFDIDIEPEDESEIVDILSEGMLVQWMKPYVYNQELLENTLNTRDFTTYSPGELSLRVGSAYEKAQKDYLQMIREYSYNHGDLSDLHI